LKESASKALTIYGLNSVCEALNAIPSQVETIFLNEKRHPSFISRFGEVLAKEKIQLQKRPSLFFEQKFVAENHQEMAAIIQYRYRDGKWLTGQIESANKSDWNILVLDHLQDPQNLGSILRSAVAFQVDAVVLPNIRSVHITAAAVKASSGLALRIPVVMVPNLSQLLIQLQELNFTVYGLCPHGENIANASRFHSRRAIVIGAEGNGISPIMIKRCDELLCIPMAKDVESLNASVSAGIVLFAAKPPGKKVKS
jgi:23S rRNA (guanosine2251-2'-O)-methyltransferase